MSEKPNTEPALGGYFRVLSRRWLIALGTITVVVGATLVGSFLQEPIYAGKAQVLLQPRTEESPFDPQTGQRSDPDRALSTEIEVLGGEGVREEVRRLLGTAPPVTASVVDTTDVIEVTARNRDPRRAATIANAYAESYIDFKRKRAVEDLVVAAKEIQTTINDIQGQIDSLDAQVASAAPDVQQLRRESLSAEKTALVQQLRLFKQTVDQLEVTARLRTGGAQLVGSATVPTSPVSPQPVRNAVLAFVAGLMLAIGLSFLVDYLDDSIESQQDLEDLTGAVPVIALIPAVRGWKTKDGPRLISLEDPRSPASEAYRTLRTGIQFLALHRPMQMVQITSPQASEGKSTTLGNLAVTLAASGERVIVVCCDLRRPRLHAFFGVPNDVGLTSVLLGRTSLPDALQSVPGIPGLRIIASGPLPANPSELLSSKGIQEILGTLRALSDIVLIDSPPILPVPDALVLFRYVDATVMVCSAASTKRKHVRTALAKAQLVDAPLVGAVLNGVAPSRSGYGYDYTYQYGEAVAGNGSSPSISVGPAAPATDARGKTA